MATDEISINRATLTDDGTHLNLAISIHNPSNRTRHLYNSTRALRYDAASKTLEVRMCDHGLVEPRSLRSASSNPTNFILPSFATVDPQADAEILVSIPRTIIRMDRAKSNNTAMKLEQVLLHEATAVDIALAWSETPYYEDPRIPYDHRQQLVNWTTGIATHHLSTNLHLEAR